MKNSTQNLYLVGGSLISFLIIQPAWGATLKEYYFTRNYQDGPQIVQLSGQFEAEDDNGNHRIDSEEVKSFSGTVLSFDDFSSEFITFDKIIQSEAKEFDAFSYNLKTKNLQFMVRTTGRTTNPPSIPPIPYESQWNVDFNEDNDLFINTDILLAAVDKSSTGTVKISNKNNNLLNLTPEDEATTPEPSGLLGIIFLCLFSGLILKKKKA
jgi:hypothetical protein